MLLSFQLDTQCAKHLKNPTLLSPTMMAFPRKSELWRVLEIVRVHHVPTNFKNCATSVLSGKYDSTTETVVSGKTFKASGTFFILFPRWVQMGVGSSFI